VKYPQGEQAGTVRPGLVSLVDVAPTVLRQAGCEPAAGMRGLNLAEDREGRAFVFAECGRGEDAMVRSRRYKLLESERAECRALYDLVEDPLEMRNLYGSAECAGEQAVLAEALAGWRRSGASIDVYLDEDAPQIAGANVPSRDEDRRRLMIDYCAAAMDAWRRGR
jgi:arylsulfatase A-like enzyme